MGMQSTGGEELALTRRDEQFFLDTENIQREGKKLKIFVEIIGVLTESP